jgi:hypothetical protein
MTMSRGNVTFQILLNPLHICCIKPKIYMHMRSSSM